MRIMGECRNCGHRFEIPSEKGIPDQSPPCSVCETQSVVMFFYEDDGTPGIRGYLVAGTESKDDRSPELRRMQTAFLAVDAAIVKTEEAQRLITGYGLEQTSIGIMLANARASLRRARPKIGGLIQAYLAKLNEITDQ